MKNFLSGLLGCKPQHLKYQIAAYILIGLILFGFVKAAFFLADKVTETVVDCCVISEVGCG